LPAWRMLPLGATTNQLHDQNVAGRPEAAPRPAKSMSEDVFNLTALDLKATIAPH